MTQLRLEALTLASSLIALAACSVQPAADSVPPAAPSLSPSTPAQPPGQHYALSRVIDADLGHLTAISVADRRAFTVSVNGTLRYWNLETGQLLATRPNRGNFYGAKGSSDGRRILLQWGQQVSLWDVADGDAVWEWRSPTAEYEATLSRDGDWVATSSSEGGIALWEAATGKQVHQWPTPHRLDLRVAPGGERLLSAVEGADEQILWSSDGREIARLPADTYFASREHLFNYDACQFWRADDGSAWLSTRSKGRCTSGSEDGQLLLELEDQRLKLWSVAQRQVVRTIDLDRAEVTSAQLSPDGSVILVQRFDTYELWRVDSGARIASGKHGYHSSFERGGRDFLVSSGGIVHHIDTITGQTIQTIEAYQGSPIGLDEQSIYTDGASIVRWSRSDGQPLAQTLANSPLVSHHMDSQGARIVAAAEDGLRVWDANTGDWLGPCPSLERLDFVRWLSSERVIVGTRHNLVVMNMSRCEPEQEVEVASDDSEPLHFRFREQPDGPGLAIVIGDGVLLSDRLGRLSLIPETHFADAVNWAPGDRLVVAGDDMIRVVDPSGERYGELGRGLVAPRTDQLSAQIGRGIVARGSGVELPPWYGWWSDAALDSKAGRVIAVQDTSDELVIFDQASGERLRTIMSPEGQPRGGSLDTRISLDPSGQWVIVTQWQMRQDLQVIHVYAAKDMTLLWSISEPDSGLRGLTWHPSGASLLVTVSGSSGVEMVLLDPATGRGISTLEFPDRFGPLGAAQFSADGKRLFVPGAFGALRIFDEEISKPR